MKQLRSIQTLAAASLLACLATSAHGITLPAAEDTTSAKSGAAQTISKAANSATTLAVNGSATSPKRALVLFNLGDVPTTTSSDIISARLRLYIGKVTKAGALTVHVVTSGWDEALTTTQPEPTFSAAIPGNIAAGIVTPKDFVSVDVTAVVQSWIAGTTANEGLLIQGDATANVLLGAKEGTGSGYPAELDIVLADSSVLGGAINFTGPISVGSTFLVQPRPSSTGANNLFLGSSAGAANISGIQNTFAGASAGAANTTGGGNAFYGTQAGLNNTIGNSVTFIGNFAGRSNTTGNSNTFVGAGAGENVSTGSNNIALGTIAGINLSTGSNNIAIGNTAFATDSGIIRLGTEGTHTTTVLAGNVGIGTTSPGNLLSLSSPLTNGASISLTSGAFSSSIGQKSFTAPDHALQFLNGNATGDDHAFTFLNGSIANLVTILANGNVGIGLTNPAGRLDIALPDVGGGINSDVIFREDGGVAGMQITGGTTAGTMRFRNLLEIWPNAAGTTAGKLDVRDTGGNPQVILNGDGTVFKPGGGDWGVASDARLKKDIAPLEGALERLLQLRSVTYEYNDPATIHELPGRQTGFIAQEVERVFPEWVGEKSDGMKFIAVKGFQSLTVQALRELRAEKDAQIKQLTRENTALMQKLAALEARDRAREARLTRLEAALDDRPARTVRAALDLE